MRPRKAAARILFAFRFEESFAPAFGTFTIILIDVEAGLRVVVRAGDAQPFLGGFTAIRARHAVTDSSSASESSGSQRYFAGIAGDSRIQTFERSMDA